MALYDDVDNDDGGNNDDDDTCGILCVALIVGFVTLILGSFLGIIFTRIVLKFII